ncbi:MAG TPA: hypothetical protein VF344_01510 [Candidatus Limnocylindrales bacterium]
MRAVYRLAPGLRLAIEGDAATLEAFSREYGVTDALDPTPVAVEAIFGGSGSDRFGKPIAGGYKSMRWWTSLTAPDAKVLGVRVELAGRPRAFARTLVQGYFVEPLISIAAARAGAALLPAAGFLDEAGAIVVLGRSGAGKTSLAMHALSLGALVLGDDQVLIDPDGKCRAFPRRLRVYSDLRERDPVAYQRLPRRMAAQLRVRRLVRILSRGAIAPPLSVPLSVFGQRNPLNPAPIRRVVLLDRQVSAGDLRAEPATAADAIGQAVAVLREQREHIAVSGGDPWRAALMAVESEEERLIAAAFRDASVQRITVPSPLSGAGMARLYAAVSHGSRSEP